MITKINIWTLALSCIILASFNSCSNDDDIKITKILKIKFEQSIDSNFVKPLASKSYNPVSMRKSGDTLFIANRADGADGVLILKESTGELIKHLTSWKFNGVEEFFDKQVIDVEVTPTLILVVNRSSRIDIFNRNDYSYITTIGTSNWENSSLLQCESAVVVGDKIFIRDKQWVKVVRQEDCTPQNRFNVPTFAQTVDSTKHNIGFNLESIATYKKMVYVTDYESSKIYVINPSVVKVKGQKIPFVRSIPFSTSNRPLSLNFYNDLLFVTCSNQSILKVDPKTGKILDSITQLSGDKTLINPGRIFFDGNKVYISSSSANTPWLKKGEMTNVEFKFLY